MMTSEEKAAYEDGYRAGKEEGGGIPSRQMLKEMGYSEPDEAGYFELGFRDSVSSVERK